MRNKVKDISENFLEILNAFDIEKTIFSEPIEIDCNKLDDKFMNDEDITKDKYFEKTFNILKEINNK
ncbi:hypothetical protein ABF176_002480, partial [Flavobacterium psychrophilum]